MQEAGGANRTDVKRRKKKLKENHIFGETKNIVHMVRGRLKEIGVGSGRTGLPDALRVGVVPARPVHSGIFEGLEGRHGPESVGKLLVMCLGNKEAG